MKSNTKKLLLFLAIPLAVGGLSALLAGGFSDYKSVTQPPLSPPGWVFPLVWSILYLLMGYSSYRILQAQKDSFKTRNALIAYCVQLLLNFLWSPVFFGLGWYLTAFFLLIALWIAIFVTIRLFSRLDQVAGDLLLPYLLWVTFAAYLNLGVFLLN